MFAGEAVTHYWLLYSCLLRDRCLATGLHTATSFERHAFPMVEISSKFLQKCSRLKEDATGQTDGTCRERA
jgi:hypothetical protein